MVSCHRTNSQFLRKSRYPDRMTLRRGGACGQCVIPPKKRHAPGIGGAV
ncbi:MAG: hypothetical protein HQ551_02415 [Desulfobacteraceae bacterium]|nr:hypothetical protein [Desulfobacteraceae bacterium]